MIYKIYTYGKYSRLQIIKSAIELFHNIEKRKNLSVSEKKYLMKTIRNRLGYGIEIGYYFIFLPNFLFTILFFILSPVYFYTMRNFFAIIYRKIKELKYFKNSLMSNEGIIIKRCLKLLLIN